MDVVLRELFMVKGSERVTGEFIVSKPTSNQQFHTHKQFEAQPALLTPRHHRYDAAKMVHALASEPLKVTLASEKTKQLNKQCLRNRGRRR